MPAAEIAAAQLISLCTKNKAGLPNKLPVFYKWKSIFMECVMVPASLCHDFFFLWLEVLSIGESQKTRFSPVQDINHKVN